MVQPDVINIRAFDVTVGTTHVPGVPGSEVLSALATFRRKNRIFGSTQAHSKAEKPHRNARWGGFEVVN
jgi:hypothetical protein